MATVEEIEVEEEIDDMMIEIVIAEVMTEAVAVVIDALIVIMVEIWVTRIEADTEEMIGVTEAAVAAEVDTRETIEIVVGMQVVEEREMEEEAADTIEEVPQVVVAVVLIVMVTEDEEVEAAEDRSVPVLRSICLQLKLVQISSVQMLQTIFDFTITELMGALQRVEVSIRDEGKQSYSTLVFLIPNMACLQEIKCPPKKLKIFVVSLSLKDPFAILPGKYRL